MRLHHRVCLIGRGVGGIELDGRTGKCAGEISYRGVRRPCSQLLRLDRSIFGRREIERSLAADIFDPNELRGRARLLETSQATTSAIAW